MEEIPGTTFRHTKKIVNDIYNKDEQREIVTIEHNRAHRAAQENVKQILQNYFFSKMSLLVAIIVSDCLVCRKAKYESINLSVIFFALTDQ